VSSPIRVSFSDHASDKASRIGVASSDVADAILEYHDRRRRNPGSANWLVSKGRIVVAYNWPHRGDQAIAYVVTLWFEE
jgi:hypothetical protein